MSNLFARKDQYEKQKKVGNYRNCTYSKAFRYYIASMRVRRQMRLQKGSMCVPLQGEKRMKVFRHHVYEYKKGIRRLILHTTLQVHQARIESILQKNEIACLIHPLGEKRMNVFFGDSACIEVIRNFNKYHLFELSDEEDFILGTMLGYDIAKQCERYLMRRHKTVNTINRACAA